MSESLSGKGKVFKGQQFIADVHYELQINSHYKTTKTMETEGSYPTTKTVDLRLNPPTAVSGYLGERLTLHLDDGRKQDFLVTSSAGRCKGTGGPHE